LVGAHVHTQPLDQYTSDGSHGDTGQTGSHHMYPYGSTFSKALPLNFSLYCVTVAVYQFSLSDNALYYMY
jgi:hypothetical protein